MKQDGNLIWRRCAAFLLPFLLGACGSELDFEAGGAEDGLASSTEKFKIVLVPDTQNYSAGVGGPKAATNFAAAITWVVNNKASDKENLVFLSHLGDIVNDGAATAQWNRAKDAMSLLDDDVSFPYGLAPGNHDYNAKNDKSNSSEYIARFGPSFYTSRTWFRSSSPNGMSSAQVFSGGGKAFLHLGLEWNPSDKTIVWAQGVMDAARDADGVPLPTILTTHAYLKDDTSSSRMTDRDTLDGAGDNSGESLYRKLVEPYPQVFMVLCGHLATDTEITSVTALGQQVMEVRADYQFDYNGGNAWMQLVTFDPDNPSTAVSFMATSPTFQADSSISNNIDRRTNSNLSGRSLAFDLNQHRSDLKTYRVRRFRQGQDFGVGSYSSARDSYLDHSAPDAANGSKQNVRVNGTLRQQGLLGFKDLAGKLSGKTIKKAILTLTTEGTGAESTNDGFKLYRMKVGWSESSTWNHRDPASNAHWYSASGGVTVGQDCESQPELSVTSIAKGTRSFDVTNSVKEWVRDDQYRKTNHGWVLVSNYSTDPWSFRSSQWAAIAERPLLTVQYQ